MSKFIPYLIVAASCAPGFLQAEVTLDGKSATPEIISAIAGGENFSNALELINLCPASRIRVHSASGQCSVYSSSSRSLLNCRASTNVSAGTYSVIFSSPR